MSDGLISIYCDESCHLENDGQSAMVLGAISCPNDEAHRISRSIRLVKRAHGADPYLEIKWTKVSPAKVALYQELIGLFVDDSALRFRAVVIPKNQNLSHKLFNQTHDDFYYKMYYVMLRHMINPSHKYNVYLDIKDTRGAKKVRKLHDVLCNSLHDFDQSVIKRVQQIRSHESELLQLADLLIGTVSYANRGFSIKSGKGQLVEFVKNKYGSLDKTSPFGRVKFNLLAWKPQEAVE